jgi:ubiquinone/menaquinone biosynthesis C-methylase UbiE
MAVSMNVPRPTPSKSSEEIARAYDSPPWWYDVRGFFILTFAYRSTLWEQVRLFGENVRPPRHLEVAIGSGTLFAIVDRWRRWKHMPAAEVVGVDYAEPMLAGAYRRFAGRGDIALHHADVAALPFPDASFASANIANAVHCFPDVDAGLREVFRVLQPGAPLALNVLLYPRGQQPLRAIAERIDQWGMRKGILVRPYEQSDIRSRLNAAGFEIVRDSVTGNTYNVVARRRG